MAQNAPVSTIDVVNSYSNTATVPVTAVNFTNIGSFSLKILYDPAIVHPVTATAGPLLGGSMAVNLNDPGVIFVSWYIFPGLTLGGNPVILNINFTRLATGTSPLNWLVDPFCSWYDANGIILNNVPNSTYYIGGSVSFLSPDAPHTIAPSLHACPGTVISVPVKVTGFNNIGKAALKLNYNAAALAYQSYSNTSGFPGLAVDGSQPGSITVAGIIPAGGTGIVLADSSVLVTFDFLFSGGAADLAWVDNGQSCQYSGPPPAYFVLNDTPQSSFYLNGSVTGTPLPAGAGVISGPLGGDVCPGQSGVNFSVSPVPDANVYVWALPPGALITSGALTNNITVTFGNIPGNWDVTVYGNNICGNGPVSPAFPLFINAAPSIIVQPVSPGTVNAGAGTASFIVEASGSFLTYQWQESSGSWANLADSGVYGGAWSPVLTITNPPVSMNGNHYRCVVNGLCPPQVTSDGEAMLSVSNVTGINGERPDVTGNTSALSMSIYPNPVNNETTLTCFLPVDGQLDIAVWNLYGKKMDVLYSGSESIGFHKKHLHFSGYSTGLYFVTMTLRTQSGERRATEKIIMQ